jgi:hypothetical protein
MLDLSFGRFLQVERRAPTLHLRRLRKKGVPSDRLLAMIGRSKSARGGHNGTVARALAVNDTAFIHVDFEQGKRVLVWRRGRADQDPVIVIANFSDWGSDVSNPAAEYRVPTWPSMPGRVWREVTQSRVVPPAWIGREPLYPWEAKVYTVDPRA